MALRFISVIFAGLLISQCSIYFGRWQERQRINKQDREVLVRLCECFCELIEEVETVMPPSGVDYLESVRIRVNEVTKSTGVK